MVELPPKEERRLRTEYADSFLPVLLQGIDDESIVTTDDVFASFENFKRDNPPPTVVSLEYRKRFIEANVGRCWKNRKQ